MEREHISRDRQTEHTGGPFVQATIALSKHPGQKGHLLPSISVCLERERENISLEREREIEREGGREICFCPRSEIMQS